MAGLEQYQTKRDFTKTSEPKGAGRRKQGHGFVIQKHDARRLHYDLRLELDGVLKSWAVTRGPSLLAGDKRLAVQVEDHPLDYGGFEGTIPKGSYGAGSVIVWDRGTWQPDADPRHGLEKGHLAFHLSGQKLQGGWHLVRMHRKRGEKRDNWLLIKQDDAAARDPTAPDILEEQPDSIVTGRSNEDIAESAAEPAASKHRQPAPSARCPTKRSAALPEFVPPCLAKLQAKPPTGERWLHEIKFDGYRLQGRVEASEVRLMTRSGLDWTEKFGAPMRDALAALPADRLLVDGELVVESRAGASDYVALREDLTAGRTDRFRYYLFDLLHLDGQSLVKEPLAKRRQLLRGLLDGSAQPLVRFSEAFPEQGELVLRHACRLSLEGIVSKLCTAPYRSGRSGDWIKSKCADRQEFVIAGWTASTATPRAIGSLVLAFHEGDRLVHAGRVGTGFGRAVASDLWQRLHGLDKTEMPFDASPERSGRDVHWVTPELVAEVEYRGWTGDRLLRHASFRGLRDDKPAAEIVREEPGEPVRSGKGRLPKVKLTHPDRIYWPDAGVTKQGLADYYADVWKWLAPHVVARPLSLLRCPDGIGDTCFFQKAAWRGIAKVVSVLENPGDGGDTVLAIEGLDGLTALVQAGVLEIHPWGVRVDDLDHPDQLTFDLDPDAATDWAGLTDAASEVRERLQQAGLESWLKTTGGKGLHVVAPLAPKADWDVAKSFARNLAKAMAADSPNRFTATMAKKARTKKIFVDWLRNGRGSTAVAAFSTRARAGAPVSVPLAWTELDRDVRGDHFTVTNLAARLGNLKNDPWQGFFETKQSLPDGTKRRRRGRS